MERDDLEELHFITPVENLASIVEHGIVCHTYSGKLGGASIAMAEVQTKRAVKRLPNGNKLHDYANLYVCARNPMLFKRRGLHAELCVLRVNKSVLDIDGVLVTDQNAASKYARFAAAPAGLSIVDAERTFAAKWTHPESQIDQWVHTSQKCAEVLVPNSVPPGYVFGAHVSNAATAALVVEHAPDIEVVVNTELFFR